MSNKFTLKDSEGNEHSYEVAYFLAREGMQIWGDLGILVKKYAPKNEDFANAGVVNLVADALGMCNDEIINFVITKFLVTTKRDGKSLDAANFDVVFAGNFEELAELVIKIFEINYGGLVKNFFTKVQGKLKNLPGLQSLSKS